MSGNAYSPLACLDTAQDNNKTPAVVISDPVVTDLTLTFQRTATDKDGSIQADVWDCGDVKMSFIILYCPGNPQPKQ